MGQGFLSRVFGGGSKESPGSGGAPAGRVSNRELQTAIRAAQDNPKGIQNARKMIQSMGGQLSNSERAEAYRQLAAAPSYRNQRDNAKDPDTTCNFTSQAMAFEALGVDYEEKGRGKQGEEQLYDRFYEKGMGSRVEENDRLKLARDQGLSASQVRTPGFSGGPDAKKWFQDNVLPQLAAGASATMGIQNGTFRHVVRVQWVEDKGVRVDDPWGEAVGYGKGEFGYTKLNEGAGDKKQLGGDQKGLGDDRLIPWDSIATIMSNRYVQFYNTPAPKRGG
jgi:hypothetical protein